ncbi:hypothetical protein ELI13_11755 [Rhizobium ruizarguesonis]|jgi:hypothetical protein|uniref:Uncharacterized protein n=2 Tax=Rhizobium TaxID=379 RepID=A0AAE8TVB2_9HYPH|nr:MULTISPECIES: hypothetical protein [Rhizobium]NKJ73276.1 hypothetical protein [Rhizobium leguminosarum bv. viciae]QIO43110.1 hypothetical protein HA464_03330 [Rhizobium leguminosarum bv. trifolii]QJS28116.1 hypothetical protein RLTA1_12820 [Rhizobium leguminosarum bv. trifolii TA1]MBC2804270.1 hypothetical protein [Rhizobium ruizarguesonis]MBY5806616.1 hypothetical protein [Rhizobium leguminosarum]
MAESEKSNAQMLSAEELRQKALELQLVEMQRDDKVKAREAKKHAEFVDDFFRKHVGDKERDIIRRVVMKAAADGKSEAMVYSFPSSFCTDSGRAINSARPEWPTTLQGKAKEIYDLFVEVARPHGYKLKAMVISFPGGMPGDIGFFLNWEAPVG